MKLLQKHRKLLETIFDKNQLPVNYFKLKLKWLINYYGRLYRRHHVIIKYNLFKYRSGRFVIVHNVYTNKGGFIIKKRPKVYAIYGIIVPVEKKQKKKRRKRLAKTNISAQSCAIETAGLDEPFENDDDIDMEVDKENVINNISETDTNVQPQTKLDISMVSNDGLNSSCDEKCAENIWDLSLDKVAAQIADDPSEGSDTYTNGDGKRLLNEVK